MCVFCMRGMLSLKPNVVLCILKMKCCVLICMLPSMQSNPLCARGVCEGVSLMAIGHYSHNIPYTYVHAPNLCNYTDMTIVPYLHLLWIVAVSLHDRVMLYI